MYVTFLESSRRHLIFHRSLLKTEKNFKYNNMKDDKIWDIHDIGNRREAAKNRLGSRRESKCESSGLLFFIGNAHESLARGRNFSSRDTPDDAKRKEAAK